MLNLYKKLYSTYICLAILAGDLVFFVFLLPMSNESLSLISFTKVLELTNVGNQSIIRHGSRTKRDRNCHLTTSQRMLLTSVTVP